MPELLGFSDEFRRLREFYAAGDAHLEGDWGFDRQWLPVDWRSDTVWLRVKLDALVFLEPAHGLVVDYKTGKRRGNEIKHAEQGQLYQLAAFLKYPDLERVTVEFWYTDQDEIATTDYSRESGLDLFRRYDERGAALTGCTDFKPNPNLYACRWCPYGPKGTGHCTVGV